MGTKIETEVIRQAAANRWPEILTTIGGIPPDFLTGKQGPCPKCQGKDRWRYFDDGTGGAICNQCFSRKNGDGFAVIQWVLGCKFNEAKQKVAEHLGIKAKPGKADPAKDLEWKPWNSTLVKFFLAAKPGITEESLLAAGAKFARYKNNYTVIAIPIIGESLDVAKPVGWCLYNHNGGTLPTWNKQGEMIGQKKIKITYGSKPGLVGVHAIERLQTAGLAEVVWKVEGVSDLLALWSAIPENLRERHLVVTNANGASETPRWQASVLAAHDVSVLHDADQPGQAGAEKWVTAIASQAIEGKTARNVQLPYEISETHGKDLRDSLADGHKYGELLDLAEATAPIEIKRTETGEVDYTEVRYPVQELILKKLQIEVLYEDDGGRVRVFSLLLRKSSWIRQVNRLKIDDMLQICGPTAMDCISSDPDGESSWSLADVRKAIALTASNRRGKDDERGIGVWQGLDHSGNETDTVVLVGDSEGARWNGDMILRKIIAPRADGLVLDFGADGKDWFEFEQIEKHLASSADVGWRKDVIEEAKELFEQWRWRNQEAAPTLIAGLVLATWVQTIWDWRPLVAIAGESNSGKSYLFEALGGSASRRGIFGGLSFRQSKSTEAGFRQGIGNTGRVAMCDEFEASRERDKIQELLRASTRGESIARGTTDQKGRQTTLRHIGWTASIETGDKRQPDTNRSIQFELLPAAKGKHGKLRLPEGGKLSNLGQKLLAIAIRSGIDAKRLAVELKAVQVDGIDARTIESYGVPAAMLATAAGLPASRAETLLVDLLSCVDRAEQGATDQDDLLEAILTANINLGPADGVRTVGQVLESDSLLLSHSPRLEAVGVKLVEGGLFIHRATVARQLLRGTDWERQRIDQILLRIPSAFRKAIWINGKTLRGVVVPIEKNGETLAPDPAF